MFGDFIPQAKVSTKAKNDNLDVLSRLKNNLTKKSVWMYILQLLSRRKALYGYEIQSAIQEEFDLENLAMSQVSCYKELYRMSQQGLVVSKVSDASTRRRRYYFITEQGITTLREAAKFLKHTYESLFGRDPLDSERL
jgi:DNA-binding PadR family transcriptional regulator